MRLVIVGGSDAGISPGLSARTRDGETVTLPYDRLVIGTAPSRSARRSTVSTSSELVMVCTCCTPSTTPRLVDSIVRRRARKAVIVGAGYIGHEMADALTTRGVAVTVLEQLGPVMPTLDPELADPLAEHLPAHFLRPRWRGRPIRRATTARSPRDRPTRRTAAR